MNERKDRTVLIVSIIVVIGLLISVVGSCLVGGLAGHLLARRQVRQIERRIDEIESSGILRLPQILPDLQELLPDLLQRYRQLDPAERQRFFERLPDIQPQMPQWFRWFYDVDPNEWPQFFDEFWWPETPESPEEQRGQPLSGALVREVVPDGPAAQAGLQIGDLITAIDDQVITEARPLQEIIAGYRPGQRARITYMRGDAEAKLSVRLGEHPDDPQRAYLGIYFVSVSGRQQLQPRSNPDQPSG